MGIHFTCDLCANLITVPANVFQVADGLQKAADEFFTFPPNVGKLLVCRKCEDTVKEVRRKAHRAAVEADKAVWDEAFPGAMK